MIAAVAMTVPMTLVHLSTVDIAIIVFYFGLVLTIGMYLRGRSRTGEDFFMAGREMTAWIAGLSFLSANLGSLELMGWAAAAYQYGILATHWYWIGAIPAMLFLGIVMMPFYYISKTHSVPGYLKLRFGEPSRALSAISFALMTVLMSGINMYSMALVLKVVLGWDIHFSIWVSSATVAVYVALGGLRSAIFNEVLQFILIWAGALLIPILGLVEAGGWSNLRLQIARNASAEYTHLWSTLGNFKDNPMGIHWTGIVFGLGAILSFGYWTTDFLVVQRVLSAKDLRAAKMAPIIGAAFKMLVPFIVILPGLLGLAVLPVLYGCWCLDQCRHRLPCHVLREHHGLCSGSFQFLHRSAFRYRHPRHVVEALHRPRGILGTPCGNSLFYRYVGLGKGGSGSPALRRAFRQCP